VALVPPSGRAERPCEQSRHPRVARVRRSGPTGALDALLADLGATIRRGAPAKAGDGEVFSGGCGGRARLATGLPEVDQILGGGLPRGRLSEIHGPASSGRTSLWLALVAGVTCGGECAAVIDRTDAFDPASARAAGVDLPRVLWARAPGHVEALRCAERLLGTEGFPLVVLDLGGNGNDNGRKVGETAWLRLARRAARTRTALVLVTGERLAGSHAEVALEMQREHAHFEGTPALFEALSTRAVVVRHRSGPAGHTAPVRWRAGAAA
jgi:hypothetical protein